MVTRRQPLTFEQIAKVLSERLRDPDCHDAPATARELRLVLTAIESQPKQRTSRVDELAAKRKARRSG